MVFFGQVVIGTAGSGKTTYCQAMSTVLAGLKRHVLVVNLAAANDGNVPYTAAASVSELVEGSEAAKRGYESLGPNGAVMYTMELLERNLGWLDRVVRAAPSRARPAGAAPTASRRPQTRCTRSTAPPQRSLPCSVVSSLQVSLLPL